MSRNNTEATRPAPPPRLSPYHATITNENRTIFATCPLQHLEYDPQSPFRIIGTPGERHCLFKLTYDDCRICALMKSNGLNRLRLSSMRLDEMRKEKLRSVARIWDGLNGFRRAYPQMPLPIYLYDSVHQVTCELAECIFMEGILEGYQDAEIRNQVSYEHAFLDAYKRYKIKRDQLENDGLYLDVLDVGRNVLMVLAMAIDNQWAGACGVYFGRCWRDGMVPKGIQGVEGAGLSHGVPGTAVVEAFRSWTGVRTDVKYII